MNARQIVDLLKIRHSKDVLMTELTCGKGDQRMDAWVLAGSWKAKTVIAYEVKVNRSDFLADQKWHTYLDYCHQFYFVSLKDVINVSEVPDRCGLLHVASTGSRLFTRVKAPRRDVQIPEDMWIRALTRQRWDYTEQEEFDWEAWVKDQRRGKAIGWEAKRIIATAARKIAGEAMDENRTLKREMDQIRHVKHQLIQNGLIDEDVQLLQDVRAIMSRTHLESWQARNLRSAANTILQAIPETNHD